MKKLIAKKRKNAWEIPEISENLFKKCL